MLSAMTPEKMTRRSALVAGAWTLPVFAAAVAVPAQAASAGYFVVREAYWDVSANQGLIKLTAVDHTVELKDIAYGGYESPYVTIQFDASIPLPGYELTFLLGLHADRPGPTQDFTVDFTWIRWFPPITVPVTLI